MLIFIDGQKFSYKDCDYRYDKTSFLMDMNDYDKVKSLIDDALVSDHKQMVFVFEHENTGKINPSTYSKFCMSESTTKEYFIYRNVSRMDDVFELKISGGERYLKDRRDRVIDLLLDNIEDVILN